jgi:methionyl-tRNA formyltransferase
MQIDLYLGGDLGNWVLDTISPESVGLVFTREDSIASMASSMGLNANMADPNTMDFEPSEVGFSVHYQRILTGHTISKYRKVYNLHPGYLPWGRGYYPVFWALWEGTPAGATLHEISERVDEGPIVAQVRVDYSPCDTGGTLHQRVREAERNLFLEYWPRILAGEPLLARPQPGNGGSCHNRKEFIELKQRANPNELAGEDLIKLIRCLTFPGYSGLEIELGKGRFEIHLEPVST